MPPSVPRRRFGARALLLGLFIGAGAAALAPAGPGALVPLKVAIASADSVGNDVYVAVVVDFGHGSSTTTMSKCVPVASNAHDSDALAAAVGSADVLYSDSGLLCAIDGYPADGAQNCGQGVGSGDYDFWSYWHGASGSWVYASDGPAEQSVANPADDVEGWRFQVDEPASPSDPPPSVAPSYAQICNAATEVPPPGSPPLSTTTTTSVATAPGPAPVTPTTAKANATPGPGVASPNAVHPDPRTGATTTTGPGSTTTTSVPGTTNSAPDARHGSSDRRPAEAAAAAAHDVSGGGSSGAALPVVLIAVVVAALGGFALFRWRRRPAEE